MAWLREQGHDVWHVRERGMQKVDDRPIFEAVAAERRVLLTFDLRLGEIVAASGGRSSVVVFRAGNRRASFIIERLEQVLRECPDELEHGSIITVEDSRHRVRTLPLWEVD